MGVVMGISATATAKGTVEVVLAMRLDNQLAVGFLASGPRRLGLVPDPAKNPTRFVWVGLLPGPDINPGFFRWVYHTAELHFCELSTLAPIKYLSCDRITISYICKKYSF
jgi:hypothetical protein